MQLPSRSIQDLSGTLLNSPTLTKGSCLLGTYKSTPAQHGVQSRRLSGYTLNQLHTLHQSSAAFQVVTTEAIRVRNASAQFKAVR